MNKRILFLYLTLYLTSNISAQSDFRKGFIITNNNDTVSGMIDFRGDISNSKRCVFKVGEYETPVEYNPQEIKGYRFIDDKFFISKTVNLKGEKEQKFLEFLVDGIVDLYCFSDVNGTYFFLEKQGQDIVEISAPETEILENGVRYKIKDVKYIGRLKYMFADAPQMEKEIEKVAIDRRSLINISKDYHKQVCTDKECITYVKKMPDVLLNIGLLIGVKRLTLIPKNLYFYNTIFYCDFDASTNGSYGLFSNISLPALKGKLKMQYEGLISSNTFSSQYLVNDKISPKTYDFSLNSTDLTHILYLRYDALSSKLHPIFQIGGFMTQKLKVQRTGFDPYFFTAEILKPRLYFGYIAGIGFTYQITVKKEVTFEITYSKGFGSFDNLDTKEVNFTLLIPIFQFKLN